jgi:hypothetical protein
MRTLNLATRPFRNEALPDLVFGVAVALVLALTAKHALVVRDLLPDKTSALHDEVKALDTEAASLRVEAGGLRGPVPGAELMTRWSQIKDLVDQRTFSWTRLLARLETVVPEGVRISAITPTVRRGEIRLDLSAQAQGTAAGFELLKRLQGHPEFRGAVPVNVGEAVAEGTNVKEFRYAMVYEPGAATEDAPASKGDAEAPDAGGDEATQ